MIKTNVLTILFFLNVFFAHAQRDSIALRAEMMNANDIEKNEQNTSESNNRVSILSRFEENIENATQPVFVVTKEEIRRMGHSSLIDVLRMLPGMQVAAAGSGIMGEHFSLRGNLGNRYMKILLNGIPIRPMATLGMPLGNQLPIKQAERIEIMYEPSLQYGEDACAGVINIITKDSERPAYTNADIKFGSQRYNEINVFFGGKFGKDKNIVKFDIYGNSTFCSDRNIYTDNDSVFLLKNYVIPGKNYFSDISKHPNLTSQDVFFGSLAKGKLPYESHAFGVHLKYKGLTVNFDNLYRQDHSALGYNPRAVSYANNSNFIGENITRLMLGWERHKRKVERKTTLYGNAYNMNPQSSMTYLQPYVLHNLVENEIFLNPQPLVPFKKKVDNLNTALIDTFFRGKRYQNTYALEFGLDQVSHRIFKYGFSLNSGWSLKYRSSMQYMSYNPFPIENLRSYVYRLDKVIEFNNVSQITQKIENALNLSISQWTKLSFQKKNFHASAGYFLLLGGNYRFLRTARFDNRTPIELRMSYKINEKIKINANYSSNTLFISDYLLDNSLTFTSYNKNTKNKINRYNSDRFSIGDENLKNKSIFLTYKINPKMECNVNVFNQKNTDVSFAFLDGNSGYTQTGYANIFNASTTRDGIEATFRKKSLKKAAYRELSLAYSKYETNIPDFVNDYPSFMLKSHHSTAPFKRIQTNIDIILQTEPKNLYAKNDLNLKYYYKMHLNYLINNNLKAYFSASISNIRSGIAAPFLRQDLLLYNPQNNDAQLFFGLNYSLE